MSNAQEPAFPADKYETWSGLTRLEWFAGQALMGLLADPETDTTLAPELAFNFAEAMCAESAKRKAVK